MDLLKAELEECESRYEHAWQDTYCKLKSSGERWTEKQAEFEAKKRHSEMREVIVQKKAALDRLKADYNEIERTLKHLRHSMTVLCSLRSVVYKKP